MINASNAVAIYEEATKLWRNTDGNNGRALRRFLGRVLDKIGKEAAPGLIVDLTEAGGELDTKELNLRKKYAEQVHANATRWHHDDAYGTRCPIAVSRKNSTVHISFPIDVDCETGTVNQLRSAVSELRNIVEKLLPYAKDAAAELQSVSPEAARARRTAQVQQQKRQHEAMMRHLGF